MFKKNKLANETSVYLLQHANNPVNWYPWGEEALEKAKKENKPILVSIGYSACHWCHVMEKESFEDPEIARLMNKYFISVKVDREEHPDIDQVYMDAVQIMTDTGGWPLNCFALPDGTPFWGGTYFPKEKWKKILTEVNDVFTNDFNRVRDFAYKLSEGIKQNNIITVSKNVKDFDIEMLEEMVDKWSEYFDYKDGGTVYAPKFPLPANFIFLLRYAYLSKNNELLDYVNLTLKKIAYGGIYDHLGGGFARYSTDAKWKVPHFEKMLYDNAQLVSLYAEAFLATKYPLYKKIVYETLEFVNKELTSEEGMFYSSLDADSNGEEGKFYVWKEKELQDILKEDFSLFSDYYNISPKSEWENGKYILHRHEDDNIIVKRHQITEEELETRINNCKAKLLKARNQRTKPGLDDKSLTSSNALMIKAYADAYEIFGEEEFLASALKNANLILSKLSMDDNNLMHTYKNGIAKISGYLDDYAFIIEAFIKLYEATFNLQWLEKAEGILNYTLIHFYDRNSGMFFYTSDKSKTIVSRKIEIHDNVIPASNSSIAKSLYRISFFYGSEKYKSMALRMLNNVREKLEKNGSSFSNWGILLLDIVSPFYEIVIVGENAIKLKSELTQYYIPNKMLAGAVKKTKNAISLLKNRFVNGKDLIYICIDSACKYPVDNISEALKHLDIQN